MLNKYSCFLGFKYVKKIATNTYIRFMLSYLPKSLIPGVNYLFFMVDGGKGNKPDLVKCFLALFKKYRQIFAYCLKNICQYYPKRKARDEEARAAYRRELERSGIRGVYMINLIRGEVDPDDPRIQ